MLKKFLATIMVATMAFSLVACGNATSQTVETTAIQQTESSVTETIPETVAETKDATPKTTAQAGDSATGKTDLADTNFDTSYMPKKDTYRIYCTYKNVHAWYDAIRSGVDAAVADFKAKGVTIDYQWNGPVNPDATAQVNDIDTAAGQGWDLIAVDVNQPEMTAKAINDAVAKGVKCAAFASSDIPNCNRTFFVGNTDNYGDGEALAKAVCEKMGGKGQIAILSGTAGAASHDQRLQAFKDVIATYPDIELVDEQRDNDMVESAVTITEGWLATYPNLGGILCNNMSNPVGACEAVSKAGKSGEIIIGGMDHDLRAFNYLKDDTLYVAQVQNCYDMGYKLIYNAVKTIDGEEVPDSTAVGSTSVFKKDADKYIGMLYGD